jgi:hypothetical protein
MSITSVAARTEYRPDGPKRQKTYPGNKGSHTTFQRSAHYFLAEQRGKKDILLLRLKLSVYHLLVSRTDVESIPFQRHGFTLCLRFTTGGTNLRHSTYFG